MLRFLFRSSSSWVLAVLATACSTDSGESDAVGTEAQPPATVPSAGAGEPGVGPASAVAPGSSNVAAPPVAPNTSTVTPGLTPSTTDLTEPDSTAPVADSTSAGAITPAPSTVSTSDDSAEGSTGETGATQIDDASADSDNQPPPIDTEPVPTESVSNPDSSSPTSNPPPVGLNSGGVGPTRQYEVQFVGNITTRGSVRPDFMNYWDQITPENEGKWDAMEPSRDSMNWGTVDQIYDFAQTNGIPFKGHTLVWGSQEPGWISGLSAEEQRAEVEEWIRLFCERYPGATTIDVVNEPDHRPPTFRQALGGAGTTGYDWIIWSFEKARQHCPNAKLILNDYNVLRYDTENFLKIARVVQDAGYLEAIGCQAHSLEDQPQAELERNLEKIAELGVPIYISEYDVDVSDDEQQREVMERQFTLFYESGWVEGITLWGYIHGSTWVPNSGLIRNDSPRPAMTWLMDYLEK